jgi:hypothetical protein
VWLHDGGDRAHDGPDRGLRAGLDRLHQLPGHAVEAVESRAVKSYAVEFHAVHAVESRAVEFHAVEFHAVEFHAVEFHAVEFHNGKSRAVILGAKLSTAELGTAELGTAELGAPSLEHGRTYQSAAVLGSLVLTLAGVRASDGPPAGSASAPGTRGCRGQT